MKNATRISACVLAALTLSGCQGILSAFNFGGPKQYRAEASAQVFGQDELEQGRAALKAGYPAEAIKQFRLAALNEDAAPDAFNGLGIAYARIGRADLAERYFKTAITLDASNPKFAANLENFYKSPLGTSVRAMAMRQKEVDQALAAAEHAAQVAGLLSPVATPALNGPVSIENSPAQLTRTSANELRIATQSGDANAGNSNSLPLVAVRNPARKEAADADNSPGKDDAEGPVRISLLRPAGESKAYPIRISLTRPTAERKTKPTASRPAYPVRIALSPKE